MSPKKLERLIRAMREQGVAFIKTENLELRMDPLWKPTQEIRPQGVPAYPNGKAMADMLPKIAAENPSPLGDDVKLVESEVPHHVNRVRSLLRMSDEELVDEMFPDYSQAPPKQQVGS